MTKEETKERIKVMQAYIDGKEIEVQSLSGAWFLTTNPAWSPDKKYRIKTEYRPFKNNEECWEEMQKHQPFGWVKYKETKSLIKEVSSICVEIDKNYYFFEAIEVFTFADGTPFGIKE